MLSKEPNPYKLNMSFKQKYKENDKIVIYNKRYAKKYTRYSVRYVQRKRIIIIFLFQ